MKTPKMYREEGITYTSLPFTPEENRYIEYHMRPVVYTWKNVSSGRTGQHTVYLFPEDVQRFQALLDHWNRVEGWHYSQA